MLFPCAHSCVGRKTDGWLTTKLPISDSSPWMVPNLTLIPLNFIIDAHHDSSSGINTLASTETPRDRVPRSLPPLKSVRLCPPPFPPESRTKRVYSSPYTHYFTQRNYPLTPVRSLSLSFLSPFTHSTYAHRQSIAKRHGGT